MKRNYQKEMEAIIGKQRDKEKVPRLFLHSCCAPCSSYVLEYLSNYFRITVFYYNPNIYPEEEYCLRVKEQQQLIDKLPTRHPVSFINGNYAKERFYELARGLEDVPEGGERCLRCYRLRLEEAAVFAAEHAADYFTTTLSVSPMKNAEKLNEIGAALGEQYGVPYLPSDFKKKNGYKRSTEISKEYGMYRQDYCGCVFSKREREQQKVKKMADACTSN